MGRVYQKPTMTCEYFKPNEFIAACESYFVGCLINPGSRDRFGSVHSKNDDGTGCCWYNNQVASLSKGRISITEVNAPDSQNSLAGFDCSWRDKDRNGELSTGDSVFWKTKDSSGRTYEHQGQIYNKNVS